MEKLYQATDLPQAYLLRDQLAQAGIDIRVFNENAQGALGELPFTHAYPELWLVEPAQREAAHAIITRFEQAVEAPVHRCPACGEENPAAFELCWQCQHPLD